MKDIAMVARTHGQSATPTTFGKEFMVFKERLNKQLDMLKIIPNNGKFGGASGNLNAHYVSYPDNASQETPLIINRNQCTTKFQLSIHTNFTNFFFKFWQCRCSLRPVITNS